MLSKWKSRWPFLYEAPIAVQIVQKGTQTGYDIPVLHIALDVWTFLSEIEIWQPIKIFLDLFF